MSSNADRDVTCVTCNFLLEPCSPCKLPFLPVFLEYDCYSTSTKTCSMLPLHCELIFVSGQIHSVPMTRHHDSCLKWQMTHACRIDALASKLDSSFYRIERSFPAERACSLDPISYSMLDGLEKTDLKWTWVSEQGIQLRDVMMNGGRKGDLSMTIWCSSKKNLKTETNSCYTL